MADLDDDLLASLDRAGNEPVLFEHPRTKVRYVLIPLAEYEKLAPLLELANSVQGSEPIDRRSKLVRALRNPSEEMRKKLAELKSDGESLRAKPDMLWHLLVSCASTLGNARGWFNLFGDENLLRTVSYSALAALSPTQRQSQLLETLQRAKVRMSPRKSVWLAKNFDRIEELGGVEKATQLALGLSSRDEKLAFVKSFYGIGEKYGRNIWMDIYDPLFRDTIAVDQRIKNITTEIGVSFREYDEYEDFYRAIAREADLELWEVDRLLFWFTDHFRTAIRA